MVRTASAGLRPTRRSVAGWAWIALAPWDVSSHPRWGIRLGALRKVRSVKAGSGTSPSRSTHPRALQFQSKLDAVGLVLSVGVGSYIHRLVGRSGLPTKSGDRTVLPRECGRNKAPPTGSSPLTSGMHAYALARAYAAALRDRSATTCAPSHPSGQVVVPADIVVRTRREDDCVPQDTLNRAAN
jgi:hypothetical protein